MIRLRVWVAVFMPQHRGWPDEFPAKGQGSCLLRP
jgi:hypothetical protein